MNNNHIQQILDELYQVDPSFRSHEEKLKTILSELLAAKPAVEIDEQFRGRLRSQLLGRAAELHTSSMKSSSLWGRMNNFHAWQYAAAGAFVLLLILTSRSGNLFPSTREVTTVGREAFGPLGQNQKEGSPASSAMGGRGGGGGGGAAMGGDSISSSKLIAPYPGTYETYKYVYKGGDFELPASVDVLRRIPDLTSGPAGSFLKNMGSIDLGTFGNAKLQNVTLVEDKNNGYAISVFYDEGAISINENWLRWNHPEANCRDEACYQALRLKISDIPKDDAIISVTDKFLADHKIANKNYGAPEVVSDWRVQYEQTVDKSQFYVPDAVTVIYPLMIDGKFVYEDGGAQKNGLYVTVNIRDMRVSSAGTITSQKYQSSRYAGVTDKQMLLDVVARGGRYGSIDPQGQVVEIEVGTPTQAFIKTWTNQDNTSRELLVPALVFPVTKVPASAQWHPTQIVVPLAQELLKQDNGGPIHIMEKAMPAAQ
jgi:hypothetical protein